MDIAFSVALRKMCTFADVKPANVPIEIQRVHVVDHNISLMS